jgi:hypothetical protein
MDHLEYAKQGRRVFALQFPNGERVPFHLLTWKEYQVYQRLLMVGTIPEHILEKNIYEQCVISTDCIERMFDMEAGIVPTVSGVIMRLSGPSPSIEVFNQDLEVFRQQAGQMGSEVIKLICRAFPAYKPEDIEKMDWPDVLLRLTQAESMLMAAGQLEEPIKMLSHEEAGKSGKFDVEKAIKESRHGLHDVDHGVPPELKHANKKNELRRQEQEKLKSVGLSPQQLEQLQRRRQ